MKAKLFIVSLLLFCGIAAFAQPKKYFIPQVLGGTPTTSNIGPGVLKGDSGIVLRNVRDTFTANLNERVRNTHGLEIIVHDTVFIRDTINKRWIAFKASALSGPAGTFYGVDSITTNLTNLCWWRNGGATCYNIGGEGVDSIRKRGDTAICVYSNHSSVPSCFDVKGNILVEDPDSLTVNGNLACFYLDGVQTCININNQSSGVTSVGLNADGSKYYFYSGGILTDSVPTYAVNSVDTCIVLRDSSNGKRYVYLNPNCRNGATSSFRQTELYGTIYQKNSWTSLADFTNNGSNASVVANKILITNGSGTFTNSLDVTGGTCLQKWKMTAKFKVNTQSGGSYGIGFGIRSTNDFGLSNSLARIDLTNVSGNSGTMYINEGTSNTQVAVSGTAVSFSAGDYILMTVERNFDSIIATAFNYTTRSAISRVSYKYLVPNTPYLPNTGRFGIFSFGGSNTIDSLVVESKEIKNAPLMVIGDSKTNFYNVTSFSQGFGYLLGQVYTPTVVSAGGFDRTQEVVGRLPEIVALAPKNVILFIGSNDIRTSIDSNTYKANYVTIVNTLQAAGIKVWHSDLLYETMSQAVLRNFILRTYSPDSIIATYDNTRLSTDYLSGDNVHPTAAGNANIFNSVVSSGKITGGNKLYDYVSGVSGSSNGWNLPGNAAGTGDVLGTTNLYPLNFITNNVQVAQLSTAGKLSIGSGAPAYRLDVSATTSGDERINIKNLSSNGAAAASFGAVNNLGYEITFSSYALGFGLGLGNNQAIGTTNNLILIPDNTVTNGSTKSIQFRAGGRDADQLRALIDTNGLNVVKGRVVIHSQDTVGFQITSALSSSALSTDSLAVIDALGRFKKASKASIGGGTGTVTSITGGFGLTGGTITTTGTFAVDTANASIISRQRAAATYQPLIGFPNTSLKYQTGYNTFGSFVDTARAAISLSFTTTGTSGAATGSYNSSTGVFSFNIPQYSGGGGSGDSIYVGYGLTALHDTIYLDTASLLGPGGITPAMYALLTGGLPAQLAQNRSNGGYAIQASDDTQSLIENVGGHSIVSVDAANSLLLGDETGAGLLLMKTGKVLPNGNSTIDLGSTSARFKDMYGSKLDLSSYISMPKINGNTITSPASTSVYLFFDSLSRLSYRNSSGYLRTYSMRYPGDQLWYLPFVINGGTLVDSAGNAAALALKANLISPSFTTPNLGTPSAGVLTNTTGYLGSALAGTSLASGITSSSLTSFGTNPTIGLLNGTGLPISTGVSGLGTGVATFLATPSSANLFSALTTKTGSTSNVVFSASPTFTGLILGDTARLARLSFAASSGTSAINMNSAGTTATDGINFGSGSIFRSASNTITISSTVLVAGFLSSNQIQNQTNASNAAVTLNTTGTSITRNQADANPPLIVQTTSASSTADLIQLKTSAATVFNVTQGGTVSSTGVKMGYVAKATSYTAVATDHTIEVTATGQTITLPTSVGATGQEYTIKLTASGTSTVVTTSSQTIDGSTTYSLSAQNKYVTVQSNGANWIIIANN